LPRASDPFLNVRSTSFQELDSIPEGVEHVDAVEPFEGLVRHRGKAGRPTPRGQFRESSHQKRGMGLPCGTEIGIDTQVEPKRAAAEPRTATSREVRGLLFLGQPKDAAIEGTRRLFLTRRHRQLHVIEIDDFTHRSIVQSLFFFVDVRRGVGADLATTRELFFLFFFAFDVRVLMYPIGGTGPVPPGTEYDKTTMPLVGSVF
jgi:hypothetical protein